MHFAGSIWRRVARANRALRSRFRPGEKHWRGVTPTTAMTHIAIQEALDGKVVEWVEKVSDDQCQS